MTGVNDKQKHKPSAKHALEEVRKSLEDLVRNQFDDAASSTAQIDVADSGKSVKDQNAGAPTESAPPRSRHRRYGSAPESLDPGQVLRSLRDLLGNELGDADVDQGAAAAVSDADEGALPEDAATDSPAQKLGQAQRESPSDAPAASQATAHLATRDVLATEWEDQDARAQLPDSSEPDLTTVAGVDDSDIDIGIDTTGGADDISRRDPLGEAVGDVDSQTPETLELEGPVAPAPSVGEPDVSQTSQDIPVSTFISDAAPPTDAEARAVESMPTDAVEREPPVAPAPAVDTGEPEEPAPAANALPPEIIDIPPPGGVQQAFVFEGPSLTAAVHTSDTPRPSEWADQVDGASAASAASTTTAEQRTQVTRQPEHSELGLDEEEKDATAAVVPSWASKEQDSTDTRVPLDADASDMGEIEVSDDEISDLGTADDQPAASDDRSEHTEDVADTLASMDVLEIPGGEQLSSEITQEIPPPVPDRIPEDAPATGQTARPEQITEPLEPQTPKSSSKENAVPTADARSGTGAGVPAADHSRGRPKKVLSAVVDSHSESLKMPGIDFDVDKPVTAESAGSHAEDPVEPSRRTDEKKPTPTLTLSETGSLLSTSAGEQPSDLEFVDLGDAISDARAPAQAPAVTLEESILSRGESVKSPSALSDPDREAGSQRPPRMPWSSESKDPGTPVTFSPASRESPADAASSMTLDPSTPFPTREAGHEAATSTTEPAWGNIPVLRDVVARSDFDTLASEPPKRKPISPADDKTPSKSFLDNKSARVKSKKPRKARHGGARSDPRVRNVAVQVIARLNVELRKCGERALSPAIIDRLQFLLREALEKRTPNVDNGHEKK